MGRHVVKSLRLVFFLLHDISSDLPPVDHSTETETRISFLSWSYQKIGAELFEGLWLWGELVLLWFKGWKAKRSPSLFCLKLHSFVRRRTTRGSSGSGFSHIKWISSSLFSICKLHFPDGASAPGCSRGTAKKRNEELCTEKTVTMRDNH